MKQFSVEPKFKYCIPLECIANVQCMCMTTEKGLKYIRSWSHMVFAWHYFMILACFEATLGACVVN